MKKIISLLILFTLTLTSCMTNNDSNNVDYSEYQTKELVAIMKTTNGIIEIELEASLATKTTYNFVGLAKKGYYDGIIFHRIIPGFMIQGGDPTGTGMGGESIYGEKFGDEFHPELKNNKYTLSMANSGPNTNGSQFFINVANNNFLDNKHSVFGKVIGGNKNVDKLAKVKTDSGDKPEKEVKIISLDIKERKDGKLVDFSFDLDSYLASIKQSEKVEQDAKKDKAIEKGDMISVHYTGTLENGEKFDSSLDRGEPIEFIVGTVGPGGMIKGFDEGVVGMKIGDKKSLNLNPANAYGERNDENKQVIAKKELSSFTDAGIELKVGVKLQTQRGELEIIEADDENVTIDANHPLAGKTLTFDIEIMDIK